LRLPPPPARTHDVGSGRGESVVPHVGAERADGVDAQATWPLIGGDPQHHAAFRVSPVLVAGRSSVLGTSSILGAAFPPPLAWRRPASLPSAARFPHDLCSRPPPDVPRGRALGGLLEQGQRASLLLSRSGRLSRSEPSGTSSQMG
jgi:hypothetical protein